MMNLSRRDFLKYCGVGALVTSAFALSGCAGDTGTTAGTEPGTSTGTPEIEVTGPVAGTSSAGPAESTEVTVEDYELGNVTKGADAAQKTKITAACTTFESLAPWTTTGSNMTSMGYCIYETLWTKNYTGSKEFGVIAEDWKFDDDYSCTVTIYDDIYDIDGNPFTASDAVYSLTNWKEMSTNSYTKYFDGAELIDEKTFKIKFNLASYPSFLSSFTCNMVTQAAYESSDDGMVTRPIGTGKYRVVDFVNSSKVVMEQTYNHWQKDLTKVAEHMRAHVDVVEYNVIREAVQIQTALETNAIQYGSITAQVYEDFQNNDDVTVYITEGAYPHCILLNCLSGPLATDVKLRQAVLYAIDNAAVASAVSYGTGFGAKGIGSPSLVGWQAEWENEDYYDYNPEKAKQLLAEAGYADGLNLNWCSATGEGQVLASQVIQANLRAVGIDLKLNQYDQTTYLANRRAVNKGEWDICFADMVPNGYVPIAYRTPLDATNEWGNQCGLNDEELQTLLYAAIYEMSDDNIKALHNKVKDLACLYCTHITYTFYGCNSGIDGIALGPTLCIAPNAFNFNESYDVYA